MSTRPTLRNSLPAAVLLVLSGLLVLSYWDDSRQARADVVSRARDDLLAMAEALARSAQQDFQDRPEHVASDFAVAATELRLSRLVLIDANGVVRQSYRQAWIGRSAKDVMADFDSRRFLRVAQGRMPDLFEDEARQHIDLMLPYFVGLDP